MPGKTQVKMESGESYQKTGSVKGAGKKVYPYESKLPQAGAKVKIIKENQGKVSGKAWEDGGWQSGLGSFSTPSGQAGRAAMMSKMMKSNKKY